MIPHRSEIDTKYAYLMDAPTEDPDQVKTVVRFSRKTQEQYVQSEIDGKPTGWRAFYRDREWQVEDKRKKS